LSYVHGHELLKLERPPVLHTDIFAFNDTVEVIDKVHQFFIVDIGCVRIIERNDWNAVGELVSKAVHCVVDDDDLRQVAVLQYPEVFDVDVLGGFDAVLAVEAVVNQLL